MKFSASVGEWTIEIKVYAWHIDRFVTKLPAETARKRLVNSPDLRLVVSVHETLEKAFLVFRHYEFARIVCVSSILPPLQQKPLEYPKGNI
jgi:hypothetical protein